MNYWINKYYHYFDDINDFDMVLKSLFSYKILSVVCLLINLFCNQEFNIYYHFEILSFIIKQIYIFFLIGDVFNNYNSTFTDHAQ